MEHISNLLPQSLNSAPATQELKPCVSGEEQKFQLALRSERVANASLEAIKEALRMVMLKLGLRGNNLPNELEKSVLIGHIISNYSGHTIEELKLAFDMAIDGQLDCDVNCYENFSCAYFSQVMNAYRKWATQAMRELKTDEPPAQIIYTDEQLDNFTRRDIEIKYQQMRKGIVPYGMPDTFKAVLITDRLMKPNESLSNFFVQRLGNGFKNIYEAK